MKRGQINRNKKKKRETITVTVYFVIHVIASLYCGNIMRGQWTWILVIPHQPGHLHRSCSDHSTSWLLSTITLEGLLAAQALSLPGQRI